MTMEKHGAGAKKFFEDAYIARKSTNMQKDKQTTVSTKSQKQSGIFI